MNKYVCLGLIVFLLGCSSGQEKIQKLLDEPQYLIKDQEYEQYTQALAALESEYLEKKITYADYLERKKELDDDYSKKITQRETKLHQQY